MYWTAAVFYQLLYNYYKHILHALENETLLMQFSTAKGTILRGGDFV